MSCTESYKTILNEIDGWVISKLAADPKAYFKKQLSRDEVKAMYKPSVTPHSKNGVDYAPTLRCKINAEGPRQIKCWGVDRVSRPLPEEWRGCTLQPIVTVRGVWFMSGMCGVTYEVANIIVEEASEECSF